MIIQVLERNKMQLDIEISPPAIVWNLPFQGSSSLLGIPCNQNIFFVTSLFFATRGASEAYFHQCQYFSIVHL